VLAVAPDVLATANGPLEYVGTALNATLAEYDTRPSVPTVMTGICVAPPYEPEETPVLEIELLLTLDSAIFFLFFYYL